jgi:hypothetical protein
MQQMVISNQQHILLQLMLKIFIRKYQEMVHYMH